MAQNRDERENQDLAGQDAGGKTGAAGPADDAVEVQHPAGQEEREHRQRQDAVSPAAAEGQIRGRPVERGDDVEVGQVGADEQRRGAQGGAPAQPAPGQSGADQRMADRIYASLASSSICTFPLSAPETGHPSLAASAALLNAA